MLFSVLCSKWAEILTNSVSCRTQHHNQLKNGALCVWRSPWETSKHIKAFFFSCQWKIHLLSFPAFFTKKCWYYLAMCFLPIIHFKLSLTKDFFLDVNQKICSLDMQRLQDLRNIFQKKFSSYLVIWILILFTSSK